MGGFDFEWNGKTYIINCEGSVPIFENDEEARAFEQWRKTPQAIELFGGGGNEHDWSHEHYLDDRYPYDPERECRVDTDYDGYGEDGEEGDEDEGGYMEADIDWFEYEKCRRCYRQFYVTADSNRCIVCDALSCKQCAVGFKRCEECNACYCGRHGRRKKCSNCDKPLNDE